MKENKKRHCSFDISKMPLNERIGFQIYMLNCALKARKNRDFEDLDLTSSQADVLNYVWHNEKNGQLIQQVDIERRFSLSNPTVTGLIQRLEAKGFVTREVSEKDKRCKYLHTTEQTEKIYAFAQQKRSEMQNLLMLEFSEDEKEEFSRLLGKALNNIRSNDVEHVEEN